MSGQHLCIFTVHVFLFIRSLILSLSINSELKTYASLTLVMPGYVIKALPFSINNHIRQQDSTWAQSRVRDTPAHKIVATPDCSRTANKFANMTHVMCISSSAQLSPRASVTLQDGVAVRAHESVPLGGTRRISSSSSGGGGGGGGSGRGRGCGCG